MENNFTLALKLKTNKNEEYYFNKVFFYANHIYNVGVKEIKRRLHKLCSDEQYQNLMKLYKTNKSFTKEGKALLKDLRIKYKLNSKFEIEEYLKYNRNQFKKYIDSMTCQMIANNLYVAVEKILYSNGEEIHFKKYKDLHSISGKTIKQGIRFTENFELIYQGKTYKTVIKHNNLYAQTILSYINFNKSLLSKKCRNLNNNEYAINFCRLKRRRKGRHYVYYVELNLEGIPPHKKIEYKNDKVGIDIGTSTIAVCSNDKLIFKELNDGIENIDSKIATLNRKADKLRRINNPQNYNSNGTIKNNTKNFKRTWYNSNKLKNTYSKISILYQKRSDKLKQFHNILANEIISYGKDVYIETMNYQALQKRSTKNEISKKTNRPKKKKRYGKSIGIHAPSQLINIIKTKLSYDDRQLITVNNKSIKASQFNHLTGEYIPSKLKDRWKGLSCDIKVQRDLYSSFILSNVINEDEIDIESCFKNFDDFKQLHDQLIKDLYLLKTKENKRFPSCMGINEKFIPDYILN